ncbi:hypothetical protein ACFY2Y_16185 [Janibacter hoylei]|jgi:hypothetical protein|uniref:hypothetical protein n=1 Tax=Janibacter hoylei TaxID=364298 RepID=UPI0036AD375C
MQLITRVDVSDPGSCEVNADCVLLLELDDGRRLPLLTDRGWGETQLWSQTTLAELEPVARMVVGPDIPFGDLTEDDMAHGHWLTLARQAQSQNVGVSAEDLAKLPHRVEFTHEVLHRVEGSPS